MPELCVCETKHVANFNLEDPVLSMLHYSYTAPWMMMTVESRDHVPDRRGWVARARMGDWEWMETKDRWWFLCFI